jgi:hypothetical protein
MAAVLESGRSAMGEPERSAMVDSERGTMVDAARTQLSFAGRLGALLVPWTFVLIFGVLYVWLLLPRVWEGHLLAVCVGVFAAFAFLASTVAAVTFSRDILTRRWP